MKDLRPFLEHTNLQPTITSTDVETLVLEAKNHHLFGVCIPPFWVEKASREINEAPISLITVIGYPLGYQRTETKLTTISKALEDGADELDVVMNISAFKTRMSWVKIELAKCSTLIHDNGKLLKVILETAYLNTSEITEACKICSDAGVDFVKTSTGFTDGATVEDIVHMRKILPKEIGIKASGGIGTYGKAFAMLKAGADRIGTSSAMKIIKHV